MIHFQSLKCSIYRVSKNENTLKTLLFFFKDITSIFYIGILKLHLYICLRLISLFIT